MKFKGFEKEDGTILKTAYFDGYNFGDRLLEGVAFRAEVKESGALSVSITPEHEAYFKTLRVQVWLKRALEFAQQNDIFWEKSDLSGEELVLMPADEES